MWCVCVCNTRTLVKVPSSAHVFYYYYCSLSPSVSRVIACNSNIIYLHIHHTHTISDRGGEYNLSIYCTELRVSCYYNRAPLLVWCPSNKYVDNAELDSITNVRFWKSEHNSHYSLCWLDCTWNITLHCTEHTHTHMMMNDVSEWMNDTHP